MLEKVKKIMVEKLSLQEEIITEDANFSEDLGVDSLDLYELVMAFEEEFEVEIPPEDLETIQTVGDVIEYLKSKGIEA